MMLAPLIGIALAMILVGGAVVARRRRGEPVGRHALIWAALFGLAFAAAALIDRS